VSFLSFLGIENYVASTIIESHSTSLLKHSFWKGPIRLSFVNLKQNIRTTLTK